MKRHAVVVAVLAVALALTGLETASAATATSGAGGGNALGMSPRVAAAPDIISGNEKTAFDYFVAHGFTKKQAAGIVGNLDQESGMDPTIKQYGGGPGRGIAQWSVGGRWDTYSGDNEVHYTNVVLWFSRYSLSGQLKFISHELADFSYYGQGPLKSSTTIKGATTVFQNDYEGCGDCNFTARYNYAIAAYNKYA